MGEQTEGTPPAAGWRLKLGAALFGLSIAIPVLGVPVMASTGLSATTTASVSGILIAGAEVLGLAAVAVMGKSGFAYIKSRIFGFLKQYGPPQEVSRTRYTIGLVLFALPVVFGWIAPYAGDMIPGYQENLMIFAIVGDLLLLVSLFVLGGDFWDKLRALFIHDTKVVYANAEAPPGAT